MSTYNTRNYMAHGGNELVIGGKLTFLTDATVTGFPASAVPAATATAVGGVKTASNQADSTATTVAALKDDLNSLLAKLKNAGIMVADAADDTDGDDADGDDT